MIFRPGALIVRGFYKELIKKNGIAASIKKKLDHNQEPFKGLDAFTKEKIVNIIKETKKTKLE